MLFGGLEDSERSLLPAVGVLPERKPGSWDTELTLPFQTKLTLRVHGGSVL